MEKINKSIRQIVIEMIFIIMLVIVTYFVWDNLDNSILRKEAYAYSTYNANLNLKVNDNLNNILAFSSDNNVNLSIYNHNKVEKKYVLYIRINKEKTTIDTNYVKLSYLDNTYNLKDLDSFDKGIYSYYKLYTDTVNSKETNLMDLSLYLSEDTPNSESSKDLLFNFQVEEL